MQVDIVMYQPSYYTYKYDDEVMNSLSVIIPRKGKEILHNFFYRLTMLISGVELRL
jgi:hypothetical protein